MLTFLLVCYGTTLIVTQSKLFASLRAWLAGVSKWAGTLFKCPMCFGFWAGVFWALAGLWPHTVLWGRAWMRPLELLAAGCVSSATCWIVRVVLHRLGEDEL